MGEPTFDKFMRKILDTNRTMTIYEVMERTGVSRQTIYAWIAKGLPFSQTETRQLRFSMTEVEQFLSEGKNRRRYDKVPRRVVKIDQKLHARLQKLTSGKQVVKIVDEVIEKGFQAYEAGEKLKPGGTCDKLIRIKKELFKKLLLLSVDLDLSVYKVCNGIISLGLSKILSDR